MKTRSEKKFGLFKSMFVRALHTYFLIVRGLRGCLKKRWVISTGYDSFGFAKIRWRTQWSGPKSPVGNMAGELDATQA